MTGSLPYGEPQIGTNEIGFQVSLMSCCSTAPTAVFDASVIRQVGASALG